MRAVVPTRQWHMIRHLNISTIFVIPERYKPIKEFFPPDSSQRWSEACLALKDLQGIQSLRLDIIVRYKFDYQAELEDDTLVSILGPLNRVKAPLFEVELNSSIPVTALERLGKLSFTVVVRQRGYDNETFGF